MVDLKTRFLRTYANLPLGIREEIILDLDNQPITWKVLRLEIEVGSEISKKALKILDDLKLLRN